jgi:hypothetical protein
LEGFFCSFNVDVFRTTVVDNDEAEAKLDSEDACVEQTNGQPGFRSE